MDRSVPIEAIEFVIIANGLKGSHAAAAGNLHTVALQLQEICSSSTPC
jgi:hypothetical protein